MAPFNRVPTVTASDDEPLPSSPSYPWGGTGPLHRHHNITALGSGSVAGASRGLFGRGFWAVARERLGRLAALWDGEAEEEQGDEVAAGEGGKYDAVDEGDLVGEE